ncbi:MAG: ribosome maturation factor RimP [Deltaproteobacteria bacterium]|nr:ribosome maturation factor RimP [Deltaproteobacteria bacterium]
MDVGFLSTVRDLANPVIEELGLELVDLEYIRGRQGWVLRIVIDKQGGVTLDDCTKVSREIGYVLEIKEVIPTSYNLEVSSPGVERPLKTPPDFERYVGRRVSVRTSGEVEGRKNFKGVLKSIHEGRVYVDVDGKEWEIGLGNIDKAKLVYEIPKKTQHSP